MIKISEWKFSALDGISFFCVRGGRFGINIFIERLKKAMIKLIDTKNITSFWKLIRSENINKRDIEALASVICGWHSYFTIKGSKFLPYYAMNGAVFKKKVFIKSGELGGYTKWLDIEEGRSGFTCNIFYPDSPNEGDKITVLYRGTHFNYKMQWVHGEKGLFDKLKKTIIEFDLLLCVFTKMLITI